MLGFRAILNRGRRQEKLEFYKVKYNLALCCLNQAKEHPEVGNVSLYTALSHLVQVPELEINMTVYEHLQFDSSEQLNSDALCYVELKLNRLHDLLSEL